ncbi:MAG: YbjQ family protein [Christensenellaceae bacterium]|jgi:uncharacterized protein YbjQ (UPF0145 family)|nr:YbjQ family protein [Christensenellaceae bacterium]
MLITTTPMVEGRKIQEYKGPVFSQATRGMGLIRGIGAGWKTMTGGRSSGQEQSIVEVRKIALEEITQEAKALGANAIVGLNIDVEILSNEGTCIIFCKTFGTAVVIV